MHATAFIAVLMLALTVLVAPLVAKAQPAGKVARIGFLGVSSASAGTPAVEAQQSGKVYRIGWLDLRDREGQRNFEMPMLHELEALGWREGRHFALEYRWAGGRVERLPALAEDLAKLKVDLIVAPSTVAALAAKRATASIPIVAISDDAVRAGLVASLGRPDGNVTGLSTAATELAAKQLELLRQSVPRLSRVAVLWRYSGTLDAATARQVEQVASQFGIGAVSIAVSKTDDLAVAFARVKEERLEAVVLIAGGAPGLDNYYIQAGELALKHRLPLASTSLVATHWGGLLSYAPSDPALVRRVAYFVDRILKGAKPADVPVEQPTAFELVVNTKTAKKIGLTIPQSVLIRADQVIE